MTFFVRKTSKHFLNAHIYIDDIVFGDIRDSLSYDFSKEMKLEFKMSMISELNFFLGIQIK
jgi:hypothetical protein